MHGTNSAQSSNARPKGWATEMQQKKEKLHSDAQSSPIEELFEKDGAMKSADDGFSSSASRRHLPLGNGISNARQRIREQAKTMVEQRKVAKRMLMMGRAEEKSSTKENENDDQIARGDAQIEQSIKLGAKYVGESQMISWGGREEGKGSDDVEGGEGRHGKAEGMVTLARPVQWSAREEAKFTAMLKWGEGGRGGQMESKGGPTKGARKMIGASPAESAPSFADQSPLWSDQSILWSDQSLLLWAAPLCWSRWVRQSGTTRQWAERAGTRLWLDIHRLEFDHHWLFTGAELRERALLRAFEVFVGTHERALKAAKEWLTDRERAEEAPRGEAHCEAATRGDEDARPQSKTSPTGGQMDALFDNFLQAQKEVNLCVKVLERAWNDADQTHGRFVLRRLEGHAEIFEEDCEGGVPMELREFFRSPMFLLSERVANGANVAENGVQRKQAVIACHYQVQIFFNDLIVCASDPVPLHWPSFCVPFGRIFDLQVFERPEQVRIRLLERLSRMGKWQEIAEVFVPLPTAEERGAERTEQWPLVGIHFASTVHRGGLKGSLGCGGQGGDVPFMQGRLFCALKANRGKSVERGKSKSDGRKKASSDRRRPLPPSLFPYGTFLCSAEILSSDLRLNALEKRWLCRYSRPQQRIGLDDGLIGTKGTKVESDELLRMDGEPQTGDMKQMGADLGLEERKRTNRGMALALRQNLRRSDEKWRRARDPAEFVREEPLPALSLFPQLLISRRPLDISRRLKPMRRHPLLSVGRPMHSAQQLVGRRRLIVNIQFATFIPTRSVTGDPSQIFLRFSTKENSVNTSIVDGKHANWQETLVMEMGKGPAGEEEGQGNCLELDMFDVEVRPMEGDDRERDTRHEREERRWLGTARMPLGGLIALGKADGHLTLQSPIFHTGYRSHPTDHPIAVRLLITIEPSPPFPPQMPSVGQFVDYDRQLSEGAQFEHRLRQRFPHRRVLAIVCSTDGKRVIASRFLRPVAPPAQIVSLFSANPKQAVSAAAQICASVPIIADSDGLAPTGPPIWSKIDEVLRFGTASADELGILLCCWLLGLQLPALLLLGASLPDGPNSAAVYVTFPDDGAQWLVLPSNGHHFDTSDISCPFLSVGTVLCADNVYVNLQTGLHPSQLDFALANRAHWAPLVPPARLPSAAVLPPFPSVQPETMRYDESEQSQQQQQLVELRTSLEREVRLHFDRARPFAVPQWNVLASRILREVLADSLNSFPDHSVARLLDIDSCLGQLRSAFRPSAVAFRFPFLSRAQTIRQVLRTQVHLNSEPQAQFALALHLQPMVGDAILGCAVAIGTLLPHTQIQMQ